MYVPHPAWHLEHGFYYPTILPFSLTLCPVDATITYCYCTCAYGGWWVGCLPHLLCLGGCMCSLPIGGGVGCLSFACCACMPASFLPISWRVMCLQILSSLYLGGRTVGSGQLGSQTCLPFPDTPHTMCPALYHAGEHPEWEFFCLSVLPCTFCCPEQHYPPLTWEIIPYQPQPAQTGTDTAPCELGQPWGSTCNIYLVLYLGGGSCLCCSGVGQEQNPLEFPFAFRKGTPAMPAAQGEPAVCHICMSILFFLPMPPAAV